MRVIGLLNGVACTLVLLQSAALAQGDLDSMAAQRFGNGSGGNTTSTQAAPGGAGVQNQIITDGKIVIPSAQVKCIHKIQIAAQADGLLEKLLADEGDTVRKGDELLRVDSRVAKAEQQVAAKELEAAQKTASQDANVKYAEKAWEVSKEEYENEMALWDQGATTYSVLRRKRLEAERSRFGQDVAQVEHENNQLSAEVAKEKLNQSLVRLEMYKVIAPYDGIIVERKRDEGEWVRSGDPVLRLVSMNEMKVEAYVAVSSVSVALLQNAPVQVEIAIGRGNEKFRTEGRINFVSPEIDAGLVRVGVKIPNQRLAGGPWILRDGMVAKMTIIMQQ